MIRNYFKMKKNEWKVKAQLYGIITTFIDNQTDVISFLKKMYEALKDVDPDELKDILITKVIELSIDEK